MRDELSNNMMPTLGSHMQSTSNMCLLSGTMRSYVVLWTILTCPLFSGASVQYPIGYGEGIGYLNALSKMGISRELLNIRNADGCLGLEKVALGLFVSHGDRKC